MIKKPKIIYTQTDEAPALATASLFPIIKAFTAKVGVEVEIRDISLASRIIALFPEKLSEKQRANDALAELGALAKTPQANIIKLPNISASIPQLKEAILELQSQGYDIPDFVEAPENDGEKSAREKYAKVLGSAVNPVLREGNSDRRVALPVKEYAKKHPHSMGAWEAHSKTHVASMSHGDFYASEKSAEVPSATEVKILWKGVDGKERALKENIALLAGEVIDGAVMSKKALCAFYDAEFAKAKEENILVSLHLKATMMKVSDPVIFGHGVRVFFKDLFAKYEALFAELGVNPNNGLGDFFARIKKLPPEQREEIEKEIEVCFKKSPSLAMVNSDKGITNFHVPSDVIIDASMPAAIRSSGKMWGRDGELHDTKALIPDRSYAGPYSKTIEFCKKHGAFDVATMGNVANVGLMAKKAEEYGSHDKTFIIEKAGIVSVVDAEGVVLLEHKVDSGDIYRMCQTKDEAIKDWVALAVKRANATGNPAVFWLDCQRSHDKKLIAKVNKYLDRDLFVEGGAELLILSPDEAITYTLERVRKGEDTISVTGNILRDYLTDLFPILELGTSAKMLSIVPLLAGGGLFETGAGGSAPKHVQQLLQENHLRWDSLGEFLALGVSLEDLAEKTADQKIKVLAEAVNWANGKFLQENKSPSRKVGELDNRGAHFYFAFYCAQALALQSEDIELQKNFTPIAQSFSDNEEEIVKKLNEVQGVKVDLGGYYHPDPKKVTQIMAPCEIFNGLLKAF